MIHLDEAIRALIRHGIGDNPDRQGLQKTPDRVLRSYKELFRGYTEDPMSCFTTFDEPCNQMVILSGVEFFSTCEHHLLPFFGQASIAYIPDGRVIGISKLARLLDIFARRLQIQERIGQQVTDCLEKGLQPLGAACYLKAIHTCMTARGVSKQHSVLITSSLTGEFEKPEVRAEFFSLIGMHQ